MIFAKPISAKQWLSIHLGTALLLFGPMFILNYLVDPFGTRSWVVQKRYKPIVHERNEKYNTIFYNENIEKFDCLILGSSRVMQIIPSKNPEIEHCYNFGVHVANIPERLFILEEWVKRKKTSAVYLGLEFYNFHKGHRPLYLNKHSFTDGAAGNYLSPETFKMSLKTIYYSITDQPQSFFEPDGSINYFQNNLNITQGKYDFSAKSFKRQSQAIIQESFIRTPFVYEKKTLPYLNTIKQVCDKHHIALYVFFTPMYYETLLAMRQYSDITATNRRIISDLLKIFGTVYDFNGNFEPNKEPENFYDPWHFRHRIGKMIIKRLQGEQTDYGYKLTPDTNLSSYDRLPAATLRDAHPRQKSR